MKKVAPTTLIRKAIADVMNIPTNHYRVFSDSRANNRVGIKVTREVYRACKKDPSLMYRLAAVVAESLDQNGMRLESVAFNEESTIYCCVFNGIRFTVAR